MEKKDHPLVSVVIPCYNQAIYLSEALDSLLQQTYQNWEAIVVNDGSPDDTENVALGYVEKDKRIKYLCEENAGPSSARNMGIKYAKGEFILPLDADDLIKPEYIEIAIDTFDKNPSIKLVYCQGFFFGDTVGLWDLRYSGYKNLLLRNAIFSSAFFRKSDYVRIGGYDENMRKGHEDWDFYIRLLDGDGLVYQIPLPLFHYRIKKYSLTTLATQKDVLAETDFYIYSKNRAIYTSYFGGGILDYLRELDDLREKRIRHKNKWYRKFFHNYIKK